jgi:hypothetical protein
MVGSIDEAVALVGEIVRQAELFDYVEEIRAQAVRLGLVDAVARRDTPALYDWLIHSFSFQGLSDRVVWTYIAVHGNATWEEIEGSLEASRCKCPKLGSFQAYRGCGYRKSLRTCAEPQVIHRCPVPKLPLRKGDLNQLAFSLYYFLRDRCDGDLVGFLDRLFLDVDRQPVDDPVAVKREILIAVMSEVFGVSDKLIAMTFANLLIGGDPDRSDWVTVGQSLVAIDSLVHNFLHRTGILAAFGLSHPYGDRCYVDTGCTGVLYELSARIDARTVNPAFPTNFPRLIQSAIWQFAAESRRNICNGRQIDDRFGCTSQTCPVGASCSRLPITKPSALPPPDAPDPAGIDPGIPPDHGDVE